MSTALSLLLERDLVHVVLRDDKDRGRSIAWSPDAPDAVVDSLLETLRGSLGASTSVVLVVGLSLLEVAEPSLPPLAARERRTVLLRDADRYFPIEEAIAVASEGRFAFAVASQSLASWVRAFSRLGAIRAIVAAPQVATHLQTTATVSLPAAAGEYGVLRVAHGALESVRRVNASDNAASRDKVHSAMSTLDATAVCRAAFDWISASTEVQLLDAPMALSMQRVRRRRWTLSAIAAVASLGMLVWSLDRWRERQLTALSAEAQSLEERAAPAVAAEERASRAQREIAMLGDAQLRRRSPDAPLAVLAHLTRLLPGDAVVQKLEWDGVQWRVDGTADHAPLLVPILDGDAAFRDVRIAATSQRFLDIGRQRETFSISFRVRDNRNGDGNGSGDSNGGKKRAQAGKAGGTNGAP